MLARNSIPESKKAMDVAKVTVTPSHPTEEGFMSNEPQSVLTPEFNFPAREDKHTR